MVSDKDECDIETIKKMGSMGMAWRISVSVISALSWLSFFILWLAFYAGGYNIYENIAIIILSIVAFVVLNVSVWVPFGMKFMGEGAKKKTTGADVVSILAGVGWLVFMVVWFLQYAGDYNIYQNLAVFIVSILAFGGISGAAHAIGWARHPERY